MSPYVMLFVLSAVAFVAVFVSPTYGSDPGDLERQIQEEKELHSKLIYDLANATKTITYLTTRCISEIFELDVVKDSASDVERESIRVLKERFSNFYVLRFIEIGLKVSLQRAQLTRKHLAFGLKWINEDFTALISRKHSGDDQECFNLEDERLVLEGRSITRNSTEDLIIVLENELQELKTESADLRFLLRKTELEIGAKETMRKSWIPQLEDLLKSFAENMEYTEKAIEKSKQVNEDLKSIIKRLEEELAQEEELIKKYLLEVKEMRQEYVPLAKADACYKKVQKEIMLFH